MDDLRKILKGGLVLIVAAFLCGIAYGACRAAVTLVGRLVGE